KVFVSELKEMFWEKYYKEWDVDRVARVIGSEDSNTYISMNSHSQEEYRTVTDILVWETVKFLSTNIMLRGDDPNWLHDKKHYLNARSRFLENHIDLSELRAAFLIDPRAPEPPAETGTIHFPNGNTWEAPYWMWQLITEIAYAYFATGEFVKAKPAIMMLEKTWQARQTHLDLSTLDTDAYTFLRHSMNDVKERYIVDRDAEKKDFGLLRIGKHSDAFIERLDALWSYLQI
ncbi:MAG: hypothetical protein AAFN11_05250, partial [Chloroflexota bacterium]